MCKILTETAESYRRPRMVTQARVFYRGIYYICPRCGITLEREFMSYCNCCGQCLDWEQYETAEIVNAKNFIE